MSAKAVRELVVKFRGEASELTKTTGTVGKDLDKVGDKAEKTGKKGASGMGGFGGALSSVKGLLGPLAAGLAALELKDFMGDAISGARESAAEMAKTEAIIKSTGGAAKISAEGIADLAESISNKTGIDDEAVQSSASLLLTFKNVKNEVGEGAQIFDRATMAAQDLSKAGFGDANGSAKMLGKALNDPIKGITALGRAGVTFTEAQKKQIAGMVKAGDLLGAQKMLMKEVESQVGGTAEAMATPAQKAEVAWGNFQEKIGGYLLPVIDSVLTAFNDQLLPAVVDITDAVDDFMSGDTSGMPQWVQDTRAGIDELAAHGSDLWAGLTMDSATRAEFDGELEGLVDIGSRIRAEAEQFPWEEILGGIQTWWTDSGQPALAGIGDAVKGLVSTVTPIALEIFEFLKTKWGELDIDGILSRVGEIATGVLNLFAAATQFIGEKVGEFWDQWGGTILGILGPIYDTVVGVIKGALDMLLGILDVFIGIFTGDWDKVWQGVLGILSGAWSIITSVFQGAIDIVMNLLNEWGVTAFFQGILDWIVNSWNGFTKFLTDPVFAAVDFIVSSWNGFNDWIKGAIGSVLSWINSEWTKVRDFFTKPIETAVSSIKGVLSGLQSAFGVVVAAVGEEFNKLKEIAAVPVNFVINTVYNDGIRKAVNGLADTFNLPSEWRLPKLDPVKFSRGGVLPGFRPVSGGDDVPAMLRSGEGVTVAEALRSPYERWRLLELNRRALTGRPIDGLQGYADGGMVRPVPGGWTTYAGHRGIDFPVGMGTPVHAWKPGIVSLIYPNHYSWGKYVKVDHGGGIQSAYAHLSQILTSVGSALGAGQVLGKVGSTGNSTGPHLHWEIWKNGDRVNPAPYLDGTKTIEGGDSGGGLFDVKQLIKDAIGTLPLGDIGGGMWGELMKAIPTKLIDGIIDAFTGAFGLGGDTPLPTLLRDRGGPLPTGPSIVHNNTGRPEWVLTPEQVDALIARGQETTVVVAPDYRGFRELIRAEIADSAGARKSEGVPA